jgi:ribonucleoside-diphosphate reductase alpha chain
VFSFNAMELKKGGDVMKITILKDNGMRKLPFNEKRMVEFLNPIFEKYPHLEKEEYMETVIRNITSKGEYEAKQVTNLLILKALERIDANNPDWTYVASYVYLRSKYREAAKNRAYDAEKKYGSFYGLLKKLSSEGIYDAMMLRDYSKKEIEELEREIDASKDEPFTYIAIRTLFDRYLATNHNRDTYELPQERFMVIAMVLMVNEEKSKRLSLVKEAYWALSNLYMTVATPTLSNAGKTYGQLSSCFIDTVDDSLQGIYDSNTDVANLSKNGGGMKRQCL